MKQQDASRVAAIINAIYSNSQGKLIGVKEFPLTPLFRENKFYAAEQAQIMEFLKVNLVSIIGERAGMKYMWKGEMPDTEKIALEIIRFCDTDNQNKKKSIKYRKDKVAKTEKPEEIGRAHV